MAAGNFPLAHAQLAECLGLIQADPNERAAAAAFHAAAKVALSVGEPEAAVEFYGACARMRRRSHAADGPDAVECSRDLERLRRELGEKRFAARWSASRATPIPLDFYVSKSIDWLRGMEPIVGRDGSSLLGPPQQDDASDGTTARLIRHAREGQSSALSRLAVRVWEPLRRFTHGRLPPKARDLLDTDDLVQSAVVRGLDKVEVLHPAKKGRFLAYLRTIIINQVRDEIRRVRRRPRSVELPETLASQVPSPLEGLLRREAFDAYRAELARLPARSRRAVVLRIEAGQSYQEVAEAVGCPSANAARMLVARALTQVAQTMRKS